MSERPVPDASTSRVDNSARKSIEEIPREGQGIFHDGKRYVTIKEGLAYILTPTDSQKAAHPQNTKGQLNTPQNVFYNPIQQFNRDLSVLAIRAFAEDLFYVRAKRAEAHKQRTGTKAKAKKAIADQSKPAASSNGNHDLAASYLQPQDASKGVKRTSSDAFGPEDGTEDRIAPKPNRSRVPSANQSQSHSVQSPGRGQTNQTEYAEPTPEQLHSQCMKEGIGRQEAPEELSNPDIGFEQRGSNHIPSTSAKATIRILDALSATGLRALRYATELPFAVDITANDLSLEAVRSIELNVRHNRIQDKVKSSRENALAVMYKHAVDDFSGSGSRQPKFDVIDLDPYGSSAPFFDAAVQALSNGGLLCVTCTDAGVWASNGYPEKAFALYGGTPTRGHHSHEVGLRLIINAVATSAARYGISVEPLLSLSIDFYARIFIRVRRSPAEVKFHAGRTMMVYNCDSGCGAWTTQFLARNEPFASKDGSNANKFKIAQGPTANPKCEHCGFKTHLTGPMYGGPIHNTAFVERILDYLPSLERGIYGTVDRLEGMLSTALEETTVENNERSASPSELSAETQKPMNDRPVPPGDPTMVDRHPFFFNPSVLAKVIHCPAPSEAALKGALRHAGYAAAHSHTKPNSIRTNAPWDFIWEMMRQWIRQKAPGKEESLKQSTAGWFIMNSSSKHGICEIEETTTSDLNIDTSIEESSAAKTNQRNDGGQMKPGKSQVVFDERLGKERHRKGLRRYQMNPLPNWGPQKAAGRSR